MLSAASVSALAFINVFASTGMVIWAVVGLVGLISGLITVRMARCRNQPTEPAAIETPFDAATQPAMAAAIPVSADEVIQAA